MGNKGKIYVIGMGPGNLEHMSPVAYKAMEEADRIVGYKTYIELVKPLLEGKKVEDSGMKREVERCENVIQYALKGECVALISSGDAGVYGMAGILLELVSEKQLPLDVEIVPGITAANAAASCLGAPLMHDYVTLSLSDLLTDWELIKKRIHASGQGDFVVCFYNPKSKGRPKHIETARDILMQYKKGSTPVGIVRNAKRQGEEVVITDLDHMLEHEINMFSMVIVGNSNTYAKDGKMITPRGYRF